MTRIAIIGGGNMGEALLAGLLASGRPVKDLVVAERYGDRARQLSETYSVLVTSVADAIENANVVIVAVKPQDVDAVVEEFAKSITAASGTVPIRCWSASWPDSPPSTWSPNCPPVRRWSG